MKKFSFSPFLLLCIMGGFAIMSSTMSKNPVLPLFIRSLGVPVETVGLIAAASTIVGIVVSIPAGVLSDIIGRRKVLLLAAIIFATAPFFYLLVTDTWMLVVVRVYHGLATAILGPVAMAAAADTFQKGRAERMAWYSSATMIGRFLAPLLGGALIFGNDFRWVYLVDGLIGVIAMTAAFRIPVSAAVSDQAGGAIRLRGNRVRQELITVVTHRGILSTSLVESVQYFAFGALETYLPVFLHEQAGFSPVKIGSLFTAQILVAAFTKPVMGRLSDRYGRITMVMSGLLLGGVVVFMVAHTANYFILLFLIGLFGLGLATVTASTSALVADLSRATARGAALGVLSTIMDVGQSLGPIVTGIIVVSYSYDMAFGVVGIGLAASAVAFGLVMRGVPTSLPATSK